MQNDLDVVEARDCEAAGEGAEFAAHELEKDFVVQRIQLIIGAPGEIVECQKHACLDA